MNIFNRKKNMSWQLKKYLYIAHDITGMLLNKEKEKEDRRVKNLSGALIILAIILIVSFIYNIYLLLSIS